MMMKFEEQKFNKLTSELTIIDSYNHYLRKRDDLFNINNIYGGKVRQCAKLVYDNLDYIKTNCNSTLVTAAGLPSPQSAIVSVVANYFDLKCVVCTPKYKDNIIDYNRISVSIAQKFGALIYGVANTNTTGPEADARLLAKDNNYFQVKFGMNATNVMNTVSNQCENLPDLKNLVVVAGSGLSALGILLGIKKFNKKVDNVHVVYLSNYYKNNKIKFYDTLNDDVKYDGLIHEIKSEYAYQKYLNINNFEFDAIYEAKAYDYMIKNIEPDATLFWCIGRKSYDLQQIEKINWYKSAHEIELDIKRKINKLKTNSK